MSDNPKSCDIQNIENIENFIEDDHNPSSIKVQLEYTLPDSESESRLSFSLVSVESCSLKVFLRM